MAVKVDRIDPPSPEAFYSRFMATNTPVIIRGMLDRWPAMARWSPEYLKSILGETMVRPEISETGRFSNYRLHRQENMTFSHFVDLLASPKAGTLCLTNSSIAGTDKEKFMRALLADVVVPDMLHLKKWHMMAPYEEHRVNLFMGGGNNITTLHYDSGFDAMLALVRGRKHVVLFDPKQRAYLYPSSAWQSRRLFNSSPIDVSQPDLEKYPKYRSAVPTSVEMQEGDVLYLPSCWWHHIQSFGFNIALNFVLARPIRRMISRYGCDLIAYHAFTYYNRVRNSALAARK